MLSVSEQREMFEEQCKRVEQTLIEKSKQQLPIAPMNIGGATMQTFGSGATRSSDAGKIDYDGFLSPLALEAYGAYMLKHQVQADGSVRESDNWQKGMPLVGKGSYAKAGLRHALELWGLTRGHVSARLRSEMPNASLREMVLETACACFFNVQGFLHECVKNSKAFLPG